MLPFRRQAAHGAPSEIAGTVAPGDEAVPARCLRALSGMAPLRRSRAASAFALLLLVSLVAASAPASSAAYSTDQPVSPPDVRLAEPTPEQLQQLVAPIAVYPDELIAQVLAAATYPEQVVEADRWMQQHGGADAQQLAREVDAQAWDPSIKALTQFPTVLANMDRNLSWTSSLGDAYVNHEQDVMDAIQAMRRRAQQAGHLQTTSQQRVVDSGSQIEIQPESPQVIYVPQYDPWVVYGAAVVPWPGWYWYPGLYVAGPGIVFGTPFGVGVFTGFPWGWGHWGCDWGHRVVVFNHNRFVSSSRTFINRGTFERERTVLGRDRGFGAGFHRPGAFRSTGAAPGTGTAPRTGDRRGGGPLRGGGTFAGGSRHAFAAPRDVPGGRWGAFSGFDRGGATRSLSRSGAASFGGFDGAGHGGGVHGGGFDGGGHGGGFQSGGFHGGGGGHR